MRIYRNIALFILIYGAASLALFFSSGNFLFLMLVWNVFLASLPLVFVQYGMDTEKKWRRAAYLLLWLVFFPNAIYMITDIIHLSNDQMIWSVPVEPYSSESGTRYSTELFAWSKLLVIALGAFYGLLIGMESLSRLYDHIRLKKGMLLSVLSVVSVSFVASFGVFIGRFLRFNSWDLMRPMTLAKEILRSLTGFTFEFSLVYMVFVLTAFVLFRWFRAADPIRSEKVS
ncbi:DUF1361 domain-containing protein [Proteiniclasticum sp. SCR006]|uniref:DUF1361 domain-containing protein n=1 Tax=Proteiniclasticum aestuarii TaxID=2817862 RepID=A0A939H9S1_9CLOT|nr:DUF1361 domain-containing protein [Proteiniclasticum aestuarii]MBO1263660.1 DUF1361 domain-containing protein [Proteiniclasticum aestuarii]